MLTRRQIMENQNTVKTDNSLIGMFKAIPWWGWVLGVALFIFQRALYSIGVTISEMIGTADHAVLLKIPMIDDAYPFVPVFVIIYLYAFIYWLCAPAVVSLTPKRNIVNYLIGFVIAQLIGFVFFIFVPTYMDRVQEGLFEMVDKPGFLYKLLNMVYEMDGGNMAYNLSPSYHCMLSAYAYLGIRKQEAVPKWFRIYTLVMAILVCMSTMLIRQHYFIDFVTGVGFAVICYVIVEKLDPGKKFQ